MKYLCVEFLIFFHKFTINFRMKATDESMFVSEKMHINS